MLRRIKIVNIPHEDKVIYLRGHKFIVTVTQNEEEATLFDEKEFNEAFNKAIAVFDNKHHKVVVEVVR